MGNGECNSQFPLQDLPAGNYGSCIYHLGLDICFDEHNYHDSLQVCLTEGILRTERDGGYNILPQYHANLTQPIKYKESPTFAIFVPMLTTTCMLGLKMLELFCTFL